MGKSNHEEKKMTSKALFAVALSVLFLNTFSLAQIKRYYAVTYEPEGVTTAYSMQVNISHKTIVDTLDVLWSLIHDIPLPPPTKISSIRNLFKALNPSHVLLKATRIENDRIIFKSEKLYFDEDEKDAWMDFEFEGKIGPKTIKGLMRNNWKPAEDETVYPDSFAVVFRQ